MTEIHWGILNYAVVIKGGNLYWSLNTSSFLECSGKHAKAVKDLYTHIAMFNNTDGSICLRDIWVHSIMYFPCHSFKGTCILLVSIQSPSSPSLYTCFPFESGKISGRSVERWLYFLVSALVFLHTMKLRTRNVALST